MQINLLQPISCGNAIRLVVNPTVGESRWRVLRKETNDFTGQYDPAAFLVHDGSDRFLTDSRLLANGIEYFYAVYGLVAPVTWGAPVVASATPSASFVDISLDVQEIVRERLDGALHSMIQRGQLALTKPSIPVMSIPFYQQGGDLPVVTVLFSNGSSVAHGLGEQIAQEVHDDPSWIGSQGWHSGITLEISAWSLNAEERNLLRKALSAAIAANLWVLEEQGLNMVEVQSVQDSEDTQSMNAPIYQTVMRLGCQAATAVTDVDGSFVDVVEFLGV